MKLSDIVKGILVVVIIRLLVTINSTGLDLEVRRVARNFLIVISLFLFLWELYDWLIKSGKVKIV